MKKAIIKTDKLCKSFIIAKTGHNVLKNISMEIYDGDFTVIMGSSGSGKSTLLYSLSTMDMPTDGTVELLGRNVKNLSEAEISNVRKKDVSFIFQSVNLLPDLTVFENIAYSGYGIKSKAEINKDTMELLRRFGIENEKDKYPSEISGGQGQRAAIARALITGSKIIFGDEPTGALNSASGNDVMDILTELNENGQSIVMVTHDLKASTRATRLLYITDGRIDGDLNLGKYNPSEQKAREELIFNFLKEHNW